MALECTNKTNEAEALKFYKTWVQLMQVQHKETGWWLGRYDKDTMRFQKKEEAAAVH